VSDFNGDGHADIRNTTRVVTIWSSLRPKPLAEFYQASARFEVFGRGGEFPNSVRAVSPTWQTQLCDGTGEAWGYFGVSREITRGPCLLLIDGGKNTDAIAGGSSLTVLKRVFSSADRVFHSSSHRIPTKKTLRKSLDALYSS
jgi:hypothetical protein